MPTRPRKLCLHCGKGIARGGKGNHESHCIKNPDVRARIMAVLPDPEWPGYARKARDYEAHARVTGALNLHALQERIGSWTEVCAEFGLRAPGREQRSTKLDQAAVEIDAEIAHARAMVEAARVERFEGGLQVCGVRKLPDGRLAWMVR